MYMKIILNHGLVLMNFHLLTVHVLLQKKELEKSVDSHADDPEALEIDALVMERTEAKKAKNFAKADEIRNLLATKGVVIIDTPNGPTWKRQ